MARRSMNMRLAPLPDDAAVLRAVTDLCEGHRGWEGATANMVARRLRVEPASRMGRGAVAHSWTGLMSAALRISPRLASLTKRGLLRRHYDDESRHRYELTVWGREFLAIYDAGESEPRVTVLPSVSPEDAKRLQREAEVSLRRSKRRARGIVTRADLKAQKVNGGE